jgi:hypothetical protein
MQAGFVIVRSVRSSRKSATETEGEGTGTEMEAVEGTEVAPCQEQPGPSNVVSLVEQKTFVICIFYSSHK